MVPREDVEEKARRLLAEGRLIYDAEDEEAIRLGDTGLWLLTHEAGRWRCSCPAVGRCSHLAALLLLVQSNPT